MALRSTRRVATAAIVALVAIGIIESPALAAPAAAPAVKRVPGDDPARFTAIVAEHERWSDAIANSGHVVGFATAVVGDGKVASARGFGTTDVMTGEPVGTATVFRLASLSKSFATALAAQLVDEGYLRWDDQVQSLVPAFELASPRESTRITVADLLSHRTGLPYNALDTALERNNEPYPMLVYRLREQPLTCPAGDCYAYQNVAFSVIGDVAFATTGDFYSRQVSRRLFAPLGMAGASFGLDALQASPDWARPHKRGRGRWVSLTPKENYYRLMPAAGINASIDDVAQWMLAQLGHQPDVLSAGTLATLHAPRVSTPYERRLSPWRRERVRQAWYAYGWRVFDYAGHRLVFHAGAVQGYRAVVAMLPDHDIGLAVLWNCEVALPSGLVPSFLDRVLGLPARDWLELPKYRPVATAVAAPAAK